MEKKDKMPPGVAELADESLNSAVGGGDPSGFFWGGDCRNCTWHCRCSTYLDAQRYINEHKAGTGHQVDWVTNSQPGPEMR